MPTSGLNVNMDTYKDFWSTETDTLLLTDQMLNLFRCTSSEIAQEVCECDMVYILKPIYAFLIQSSVQSWTVYHPVKAYLYTLF